MNHHKCCRLLHDRIFLSFGNDISHRPSRDELELAQQTTNDEPVNCTLSQLRRFCKLHSLFTKCNTAVLSSASVGLLLSMSNEVCFTVRHFILYVFIICMFPWNWRHLSRHRSLRYVLSCPESPSRNNNKGNVQISHWWIYRQGENPFVLFASKRSSVYYISIFNFQLYSIYWSSQFNIMIHNETPMPRHVSLI